MSKKIFLSTKDFSHLISLTKLSLSKKQRSKIRGQLSEALNAISVLNELNTKKIQPLNHPTGTLKNVLREDKVFPSLTQKQALSNAKNVHNGLFVVKAIFQNE